MSITGRLYGKMTEGQDVLIFTLTNSKGMKAEITNYGGIIVSLFVPDKNGKLDDITLGFDSLEGYLKPGPFFGAIVGRHANRIEDGKFELNGKVYDLYINDRGNHLHGGLKGFDKVLWNAEIVKKDGTEFLELTYRSVDGEENYPGNLDVKVTYSLTEDNALVIDYYAVTDRDTVVNLTNHAYFNLKGHAAGDVIRHELMINADKFTVIDDKCIPNGELRSVKGTPMDFTTFKTIEPGLKSDDRQIGFGGGYDHNWVLNVSGKNPEKAAELYEPESGRLMEVYTTKPGVQFYSGNYLSPAEGYKDGAVYNKWSGMCLETQYFPNAMKHKHFPSPVLKVGDEYRHTTIYKFLTK